MLIKIPKELSKISLRIPCHTANSKHVTDCSRLIEAANALTAELPTLASKVTGEKGLRLLRQVYQHQGLLLDALKDYANVVKGSNELLPLHSDGIGLVGRLLRGEILRQHPNMQPAKAARLLQTLTKLAVSQETITIKVLPRQHLDAFNIEGYQAFNK